MAFTYLHFYMEFLKSVKKEYGIEIHFKEDTKGALFPNVEEEDCEICFNPKLLVLVFLYNIYLHDKGVTTESVSLYTLYNMYMSVDEYDQAQVQLDRLENELTLIGNTVRGKNVLESVGEAANLQMLFILLHETYHILLSCLPGIKEQFLEGARQRVEDLKAMLPSSKNERQMLEEMYRLIPAEIPSEEREKMKKEMASKLSVKLREMCDYDLYLNKENGMLEELACDLQAWNLLIHQLEASGCPSEHILQANAWIFMSLNIMDYDKFLGTLYKDDCAKKDIVNPRTAVLRHSFLRSYIFTYYSKNRHHTFSDFKQIAEGMEDNGRAGLIANMFHHTEDIAALKKAPFRIPNFAIINELEAREHEIRDKVLRLAL